MKKTLQVREAAALLSCSPRTIYNLIAMGHITAFRFGIGNRSLRIYAESLEQYVHRQIDRFCFEEEIIKDSGNGV